MKHNGSKRQNGASKTTEQIVIDSSSEEEPANVIQPEKEITPVLPSKIASKKVSAPANGRTKSSTAKGKGKAIAEPSRADHSGSGSDELMAVDDIQVAEVDSIEAPGKQPTNTRPAGRKSSKADTSTSRQIKQQEELLHEVESLRRQLENVVSERDKYSKQLEELFHIRHTEPEETLEQQSAQYEARLKTQESMINELTAQLTKIKALGGSEKSYMLHFLTREAADEEKETMRKEVERWKDIVKQKDAQLTEKDQTIATLEAQEKVLRSDLAAEIERGRILATRNPPPSSMARTHVKSTEDPKNALVIRLYEDMTNFLVVSAKIEKSVFLNLDEPMFTCIYTHREGTVDAGGASLNFTLRETWEKPDSWDENTPISTKDDLIPKVKYMPRNLENEPEEFVQNLDFFKDAFIFSRDQLPVFLSTLTQRLAGTETDAEDENENEEDQLQEDVIEIDG